MTINFLILSFIHLHSLFAAQNNVFINSPPLISIDKLILEIQETLAGPTFQCDPPEKRPVFDFQVSKKFANNKAELRLNIQDILNRTLYFYQNPDGNARLDKANDPFRLSRTTGTNYGVSFSYSL